MTERNWPTRLYSLAHREIWRFVHRPTNTILPPLVTNILYIGVFGVILGQRIGSVDGFTYLQFVIPGLVVLASISNAFQNSAFSVFHARWDDYIDAVIASPISNKEQVTAYIIAGVVRGMMVGLTILALGFLLAPVVVRHPVFLVVFLLVILTLFAALGLIAALWADDFDQVTIFIQFLIRPLVFFGGVFYPISDLPPLLQTASYLNPMVYMVSGVRYALLGTSQVAPSVSLSILSLAAAAVILIDIELFRRGYGLTD